MKGIRAVRRNSPQNDNMVLEAMVDAYGLQVVLMALANICYEKAEHVDHAWQDSTLARAWRNAGTRLEDIASGHWPS